MPPILIPTENSERSFVLTAAKKKGFVPWLGTTLFVQTGGHISESLGQDVRRWRQDKQCSEGAGGEGEGREEGGGELLREAGDQDGDHRQGDAAGGRRHPGHFPQRWALASRNWLLSFISAGALGVALAFLFLGQGGHLIRQEIILNQCDIQNVSSLEMSLKEINYESW